MASRSSGVRVRLRAAERAAEAVEHAWLIGLRGGATFALGCRLEPVRRKLHALARQLRDATVIAKNRYFRARLK